MASSIDARTWGPGVDALPVRLACGHFALDGSCDECEALGDSPDPWLVAGEDINLNRQAETRAYRQSKIQYE